MLEKLERSKSLMSHSGRTLEDKNAERNVDSGDSVHEVLEENKH